MRAVSAVKLRSFKLQLRERRARIVPETDCAGCPFSGPGVDLNGGAVDLAFARAAPMLEALAAFEPGVGIRSVSVDLTRPRLLATLDPTIPEADPRPRVVRLDDGAALRRVLRAAEPLVVHLAQAAGEALQKRARG